MPIPLIKAPSKGCPTCDITVCKITSAREVAMVDWSDRLADGDTIASVTHSVAYLSGYSANTANLTATGNNVYSDTETWTLLGGGRADSECHENECYRVTAEATTSNGEVLTQSFQVKTKYLYDGAIAGCCDDRNVVSSDTFRIPVDNCNIQPPKWCKTPDEEIILNFDFSDWLKMPNGDPIFAAGGHGGVEIFNSGYIATSNAALVGSLPLTDDVGNVIGSTTRFTGGSADGKRGQCYYGFIRLYAANGQQFFYPYNVQIKDPSCQGCCG